MRKCSAPCYFNPRSYKRSDGDILKSTVQINDFNPRSYKRSDGGSNGNPSDNDDFNPRSYKRSDSKARLLKSMIFISIHAPTRGATAKMHNYPYTYL